MTHVLGDNKEEIMSERDFEAKTEVIVGKEPEKKNMGVVTVAKKLRLRKQPNKDSEIICLLNEGDEVEILKDKSTHKFYRVVLSSGVEGFCMKEFITLK